MIDRAHLEALFGAREIEQLSGGPAGNADADALVDDAIQRATEEAQSRLSIRYTVPIADPTVELMERVADLARARLYTTKRPDYVQERADDARSYLDSAARGRREIVGLTPRAQTNAGIGLRGRADRTFTRESLDDYR